MNTVSTSAITIDNCVVKIWTFKKKCLDYNAKYSAEQILNIDRQIYVQNSVQATKSTMGLEYTPSNWNK